MKNTIYILQELISRTFVPGPQICRNFFDFKLQKLQQKYSGIKNLTAKNYFC